MEVGYIYFVNAESRAVSFFGFLEAAFLFMLDYLFYIFVHFIIVKSYNKNLKHENQKIYSW